MSRQIKIKSVTDLGPQLKDNKHEMVGQDGAYSIPLEKDTLWFFGDTLIGARNPGESIWYPGGVPVGPKDMSGKGTIKRMINNTGLLLNQDSGIHGLKEYSYILDKEGSIKTLIELTPDEDPDEIRVWCLHGVSLDDKIYLFFIKVRMIEEGIFPVNFTLLGSGIAVGSSKDWKFERIISNNSDLLWKDDEPKFASAVLKDRDSDWLYLYGVIQQDFVQKCYMAKVKQSDIEKIESYQYFSGNNGWSKNIKDAIPVFTGMPNELSVSYNNYLGCYLAVHSLDLSGKVVGRTSDTPWGPWSEPIELYQVKAEREKELPYPVLIYAGKEHPSLSDENGKIVYTTYIEFEEYYPHLVKIEFE